MLVGEFQHNIDAKGRMIMPAKFRDELGEKFIVTIGLDRCLFVFPMDTFMVYKEKLDAISLANRDAREFTRFFFASSTPLAIAEVTSDALPRP